MVNQCEFTSIVISSIRKILGIKIDSGSSYASLSDSEVDFVAESIALHTPEKALFLEVGTLFGFNLINQLLRYPTMKAIVVENFTWNPYKLSPKQHELILLFLLKHFKVDKQVQIYNSLELIPNNLKIDFIFIDWSHEYNETKKELIWAIEKAPKVLMGDDYRKWEGVTKAVDELVSSKSLKGKIWKHNF